MDADSAVTAAAERVQSALAAVREQKRRLEDVRSRYFEATRRPGMAPNVEGAEDFTRIRRMRLLREYEELTDAAADLAQAVQATGGVR